MVRGDGALSQFLFFRFLLLLDPISELSHLVQLVLASATLSNRNRH